MTAARPLAAALVVAAAGLAHAAPVTLINDNFEDGPSSPGTPSPRGISPAFPWYALQTGGNIEVINDTAGPSQPAAGDNYRRRLPTTTGYMAAVTNLTAPVNLVVGDTLELTFLFNLPARHQAREGFLFGLLNSNGTKLTADGQASVADNDAGYTGLLGVSPSGSFSAGDIVRETGLNGGMFQGTDRSTLPTTLRTTGTVSSSATHSARLFLELLAPNNLRITEEVRLVSTSALVANIIASDATPFTTFDQVAIGTRQGSSTTAVEWRIDNVTLVYTAIPEPASAALLGLAALAGLGRRRGRH